VILVDTSIWVEHLRHGDPRLSTLLREGLILIHPLVIAELALGDLRDRDQTLVILQKLPQAPVAFHHEVIRFVSDQALFGRGIGYVDAHLLTAARLVTRGCVWTRDKRLLAAAERLSLSVGFPA
jgi:predicted nucleic acid-binding protein